MSIKRGTDLAKFFTEFFQNSKGFDRVINKLKLTHLENGKCTAEFQVSEEHLNRFGGLHGGFTATLVDNVTTYALMSKGEGHPGVSVDLHVSYLKGAREGDVVLVDANTVRKGRKLAYLECELKHKKDGSIIAKGSQTKYVDM